MAKTVEIYELVRHHCTNNQISDFLRQQREAGASEILISGKKEILLQHLKEAVQDNRIRLEDVIEFLRESEENGNQRIFFFLPKSKKMRDLCNDPEKVAGLLFERNLGTMKFSLYDRIPSENKEYIWSDFRKLSPDKMGWLAKLYGLEHELVLTEEDRSVPRKVVKSYDEVEQRNVCVVRWDKSGLLQIRVPRGETEESPDNRAKEVWAKIQTALPRSEFSEWDTTRLRRKLVEDRKKHTKLYCLPTLQLLDSNSGTATFACRSEEELETAPAERDGAIDLYLNKEEISCRRLVVVWLADNSEGHLEQDLRVILGSRHPHEVIIQPRVSSEVVDYVTNRLRELDR